MQSIYDLHLTPRSVVGNEEAKEADSEVHDMVRHIVRKHNMNVMDSTISQEGLIGLLGAINEYPRAVDVL